MHHQEMQSKTLYSVYGDKWAELENGAYNQTINEIKDLESQEYKLSFQANKLQSNIETFEKFVDFQRY